MKRITTATKSVDKFGAGKHGFTSGNAVAGVPATDLEDSWFDNVQEELCAVVEAAGLGLDGGNRAQLLAAMRSAGVFQTAAQFDASTKMATMAALQRALGNMQTWSNVAHGATMPAALAGSMFGSATGGANTHYLPLLSDVPVGATFSYCNTAGDVTTIMRSGADSMSVDGAPLTSYQVLTGQSLTFVKATAGTWLVTNIGVNRGPAYRQYSGIGGPYTIAAKDIGSFIWFSGNNVTITLPTPASLNAKIGDTITFFTGGSVGTVIAVGAGAFVFNVDGSSGNVPLKFGQSLTVVVLSNTTWQVTASTANLAKNADFAASLAAYGFQKLPSGLILQWGYITTSASGDVMLSFPIAFPVGVVISGTATYQNDSGTNPVVAALGAVVATGCGVGGFNPSTNARVGAQVRVLVLGY